MEWKVSERKERAVLGGKPAFLWTIELEDGPGCCPPGPPVHD